MTWPIQNTSCSTTWGDSDNKYEQVKCYSCDELLVITIIGGVYMENMNCFLCEDCYHNFQDSVIFTLDYVSPRPFGLRAWGATIFEL